MSDSAKRPSDALTTPRRPLLVAAVITGVVVALSGIGVGAYAIGQAVTAETTTNDTPQVEPTYTDAPNVAPVAIIQASVTDLTVTVDGSSTVDGDGEIVEFAWDFGDGATAVGPSASHAYGAAGTYTVTLTATDDEGATSVADSDVTVAAPPPPPPPPAAPASCPAGSFVAQGGPGVELLCMWDICRTLTLPDPSHPECDSAFRP